jgi:lipopolysaccharide export system permease protein
MIFKRTLQGELIFYTSAVYAALSLVTLTFTLIQLLTQAVDGRIDPKTVFVLLGFALVNFQAIILSLSVFIGTLLVFSRMWKDSEMTIWQASGLSLSRFVWPTLRFAIPIALLAALFSMVVAPWANRQAAEFRDSFEKRDDLSRVATQQFKENRDGSRIFYVGNVDESSKQARNLFVVERNAARPNVESVVAAQQGRVISLDDGDRYLELSKGRRYQLPKDIDAVGTRENKAINQSAAGAANMTVTPTTDKTQVAGTLAGTSAGAGAHTDTAKRSTEKSPEIGLMKYEQYTVLLAEKQGKPSTALPPKQRGTLDLVSDNNKIARGELIWRLDLPIMCLLLAFLAVPLSYFNPRSGKSAPLVISILLFVIYVNALNTTQSYVQSGKLKPIFALLAPHLAVLLLAVLLLLWRSQGLMRWFGAKTKASANASTNASQTKTFKHLMLKGRHV